jgi:hypothetical protein
MADNPDARKPGDSINQEIRQSAEKGAEATKRTSEATANIARRGAEAATDATRNAADQSGEAAAATVRATAEAQAPLVDAGFQQSQRVMEAAAQVADVYRDAAERAGGDVQALFDAWTRLTGGLQRWQQTYFDHLQQCSQRLARRQQDLIRSDSPLAFAEAQRELYFVLVGDMLRASTTLLQLSGQIVQEALQPLQQRRAS